MNILHSHLGSGSIEKDVHPRRRRYISHIHPGPVMSFLLFHFAVYKFLCLPFGFSHSSCRRLAFGSGEDACMQMARWSV